MKVDCEPGSEYRATKARGDIKRKGKPDPYAYVPLTRSVLNRRSIDFRFFLLAHCTCTYMYILLLIYSYFIYINKLIHLHFTERRRKMRANSRA